MSALGDGQALSIPPEPFSAAWLSETLRAAGCLPSGAVRHVEITPSAAFNSRVCFLRLRYTEDAPPGSPERLVLKRNNPEPWGIEAGMEEVKFYRLVNDMPEHPPVVPPCYAAHYRAHDGESFVLLRDLSETHAPPVTRAQQIAMTPDVPTQTHMEQVIDTLAQLHAYWWQHPLLGQGVFQVGYWSRDRERFELYLQRRERAWRDALAHEQIWWPEEVRPLYERTFAALPKHWERALWPRFQRGRAITLIHGDAYFANFLCPKASGPTYLLDWQSPTFDLGAYDLVNLLATFWLPERRHEQGREIGLLRRYHAGLCANGVQDYSWAALQDDYRAGLLFWLMMPLQDRIDGVAREYWWPKMQCLMTAFCDWEGERYLASFM